MSAREAILRRVRSKAEHQPGRVGAAGVDERIARHAPNLIPARAQLPPAQQLDLLEEQAKVLSATVRRVGDLSEIPEALADYLRQQNLPTKVKRSPAPELRDLPWDRVPLLELTEGAAVDEDAVSLTPAFCAVAETATLVLQSSPQTPTTLAFLPETHVVMLKASQVVGTYEEAFARTRAALGEGQMPRSFNFITGPSRTGDIEQKIELGAHGPRRLHIILVDDLARKDQPTHEDEAGTASDRDGAR